MAPEFSPKHVANVKALSREGFFANGAVTRVQDNFVSQWAQAADPARPPKVGVERLDAAFTRPRAAIANFDSLPEPDTYAPEVGFVNGMYAARLWWMLRWVGHDEVAVLARSFNRMRRSLEKAMQMIDG
jgi:peptidylprolyl isomerase